MFTKVMNKMLLLVMMTSCHHSKPVEIKKNQISPGNFKVPHIIQQAAQGTVEYTYATSLTAVWPKFISKFPFKDTLTLTDEHDSTIKKDFMWEYSGLEPEDTMAHDGFELFTDYKTTLWHQDVGIPEKYYFYPVFVVNQTPSTKIFIGKDNYVFAIQEAVDTNGRWRPIESRSFDFCGNGYFGLKVHSKEFVLFLMPKYKGTYKTQMRVRLQIADNIYISQPFEGEINPEQFIIKKTFWGYNELKKHKLTTLDDLFYGACPFGYDEI